MQISLIAGVFIAIDQTAENVGVAVASIEHLSLRERADAIRDAVLNAWRQARALPASGAQPESNDLTQLEKAILATYAAAGGKVEKLDEWLAKLSNPAFRTTSGLRSLSAGQQTQLLDYISTLANRRRAQDAS